MTERITYEARRMQSARYHARGPASQGNHDMDEKGQAHRARRRFERSLIQHELADIEEPLDSEADLGYDLLDNNWYSSPPRFESNRHDEYY